MGYDFDSFPKSVKDRMQIISVKFSPADLNLALTTKCNIGKTFDQAIAESEEVVFNKGKVLKWRVLSNPYLPESKRRAARPNDLLDIQQLEPIRNK